MDMQIAFSYQIADQCILALCSDWGILLSSNQVDQGVLAFGYAHTEH